MKNINSSFEVQCIRLKLKLRMISLDKTTTARRPQRVACMAKQDQVPWASRWYLPQLGPELLRCSGTLSPEWSCKANRNPVSGWRPWHKATPRAPIEPAMQGPDSDRTKTLDPPSTPEAGP